MSRFRKLSQTIWHCQYHIVWVPKYRFRVLTGKVAEEVNKCVRVFSEQQGCEIVELNIQFDHAHLLVMVPPKVSISGYVGAIKGRTAIRVLSRFRKFKKKPCGGHHLWARGGCVDTVGLDAEMIRKHIKYQQKKEEESESTEYLVFTSKVPFQQTRAKSISARDRRRTNRPMIA